MWYLESWLWEQISWLKPGDWCCSLIIHGGRLAAGRAGGLAPSIQMGRFHVRNVLLGSGCVEKCHQLRRWLSGQIRLQKQESALHQAGVLCLLLRIFLSWSTVSWANAWLSHGEFTLLKMSPTTIQKFPSSIVQVFPKKDLFILETFLWKIKCYPMSLSI